MIGKNSVYGTILTMIDSLTTLLRKIYQPLPRLDGDTKKWFRDNLWIFALIIAIICALNGLQLLVSFVRSLETMTAVSYVYMYASSASVLDFLRFNLGASMLLAVVEAILFSLSVLPLKEYKHRGWTLLLFGMVVAVCVAFLGLIVGLIVMPSTIIMPVLTLLMGLASLYIVVEVSDEFAK